MTFMLRGVGNLAYRISTSSLYKQSKSRVQSGAGLCGHCRDCHANSIIDRALLLSSQENFFQSHRNTRSIDCTGLVAWLSGGHGRDPRGGSMETNYQSEGSGFTLNPTRPGIACRHAQ